MRLHFKEFFENLIHEGYIYIISTFSSFNFPLCPKIKISCSSLIIDIHVCLSCNLYIRQSPFNIFQLSVFLGLTSWGWVSLLIKEGSFCSRQKPLERPTRGQNAKNSWWWSGGLLNPNYYIHKTQSIYHSGRGTGKIVRDKRPGLLLWDSVFCIWQGRGTFEISTIYPYNKDLLGPFAYIFWFPILCF